jgi:hypothetical protein
MKNETSAVTAKQPPDVPPLTIEELADALKDPPEKTPGDPTGKQNFSMFQL